MTTMNPYSPPRAKVQDSQDGEVDFQEPKVWSARGRIGRLRFLAYTMCAYVAFALVSAIGAFLTPSLSSPIVATALMGIAFLGYLALLLLSAIQRAHDMDWSGWMALIALIPLVGLIWIFKGGTPGENRFGAPPTPNPRGVKIAAMLFPVVFIIGILAAIALPQYQAYVQRAHAAQLP